MLPRLHPPVAAAPLLAAGAPVGLAAGLVGVVGVVGLIGKVPEPPATGASQHTSPAEQVSTMDGFGLTVPPLPVQTLALETQLQALAKLTEKNTAPNTKEQIDPKNITFEIFLPIFILKILLCR